MGWLRSNYFPEIEPLLLEIAEQILGDDPHDEDGRLSLTASLIVLVDGEVAHNGSLRGAPVYWRRLATTSHASLIERELVAIGIDSKSFTDWAEVGRGQYFFLQTLVDLRTEPRWLPDFLSPQQIRHEFLGRMVSVAEKFRANIQLSALQELLLGGGPNSAKSQLVFPFPYLPGPLEGGIEPSNGMPSATLDEVAGQLAEEKLDQNSFAGLVNLALIFKVDAAHAKLATEALRRVKHQIRTENNSNTTFNLLSGLAILAAVTRTPDLADEVRILVRVLRRRSPETIDAEQVMRIGLIAAACHKNIQEWCKVVGEWFKELAFENLEVEQFARLLSHLDCLCKLEPRLWTTCASAIATLEAVGMNDQNNRNYQE